MSIALMNRVDRLTERVESLERTLADVAEQVLVISQQLQALSLIPPQARKPTTLHVNGARRGA